MSLANYSTTVKANKTVSEIQNILVSHGATNVMFEYRDAGYIKTVTFLVAGPFGLLPIRLPCSWQPVLEIMEEDLKIPRHFCNEEQAIKVAWRIVKDWVRAQMAILETQMVTMDQVFLPYIMVDRDRSVYDRLKEERFLLGGGGNQNEK